MASTNPINNQQNVASLDVDLMETDPSTIGRVGLLNGMLIGVAVSIGLWGVQFFNILSLPLAQKYNSILLASLLIILLCSLVGWVSGWLRKTAVSVLLWSITAVLITFIATYQPYQIRTFTAWIVDSRFWGLDIFPFATSFTVLVFLSVLLASIFLILLLMIMGLFQDTRLETINQERGSNGRLNRRAWAKLLLPMPLIILMGYLTANIMANNSWKAIPVIDQVIHVVRDYDGDLFQLGLEDGINYAAAKGVKDQFEGDYTLSVGNIDAETLTTIIVADFDNGAWINCRFLNDQLNFCYDGSHPYTTGFNSLITGESVPEDCRGCQIDVEDDQWAKWLQARSGQLGVIPILTRTGMQGEYVIMEAKSSEGDYAVQCWFNGRSPVEILRCEEIE